MKTWVRQAALMLLAAWALWGCSIPDSGSLPPVASVVDLNPETGTVLETSAPRLSWEPIPEASIYQVQLTDTLEDLESTPMMEVPDASIIPSDSLNSMTTYYWRVRALNTDRRAGPWSEVHSFVLRYYITGEANAEIWNTGDGYSRYQAQIDSTLDKLEGAALEESMPGSDMTRYYFSYQQIDEDGESSSWSAVFSMEIGWGEQVAGLGIEKEGMSVIGLLGKGILDGMEFRIAIAEDRAELDEFAAGRVSWIELFLLARLEGQIFHWQVRPQDETGEATGTWRSASTLILQHAWNGEIFNPVPANGQSITDTTPKLSWDAVEGADRYQIQIADTEEAISTAAITETASASHTPKLPLANLQTHRWRARAVDADGQSGPWSEIQAIHVNWGSITNPVPADGQSTADTTPQFQWDAVDGALKYQMQVAPISDDLDRAPLTETTGPSHTPSQSLTNLQTYRWQVRAVDADDQFGPWSGAKTVKIEWGTLENSVPSDGQSTADTTPELSWDAVSGADRYQIQIADTKEAISTAAIIETASPSHTPQLPLTNLQTHYWRARAVDAAGHYGSWSESRAIHVNWGSIANPDPADGQSVATTTPQFKWDAVDGALKYQMQVAPISDDLDRASLTDTTGPSHTPSQSLTNLQTYRWRVRAVDADGQNGQWTAPQSVFVDWGKITGITPPSGAGTANPTPSLSWDSLSNTAEYEVRFSSSNNLESAATQSVTESEYTPTISLEKNRLYYWQVRALHDDGFWGPWSEDFILAVIPYLVYVEGGTFTMGSPESESYRDEDETQHEVSVSSFYIGKYEVTAREYYDVMGDRAGVYYSQRNGGPSSWFIGDDDDEYGNGNFPAFAGWYDAVEFCNALSRRDGLDSVYTITYGADGTSVESVEADWTAIGYRLPTEAEWEYAARGGRNSNGYLYAGSDDPVDAAWFRQSSIILTGGWSFGNLTGHTTVMRPSSYPHEAGYLQANELGLHDMSGNAAEWCWDWYAADYYEAGSGINPRGPAFGTAKVARGGDYGSRGGAVTREQTYEYIHGGKESIDGYTNPDNDGTLRVASRSAVSSLYQGQIIRGSSLTTVGFRIVLPLAADEGGP